MAADDDRLDKLTEELQEIAGDEAQALAKRELPLTPDGVAQARAEMERVQKRMAAKRREIEKVQEEVKADIERQSERLRDMVRRTEDAVSTVLEPVQKLVKNLEEGLTSMSLYLGRGEEIVTVREGKRAGQLEPIVIRQMVLAMDEETGIFAESGGIDAGRGIDAFDEWLLEDEAHVRQIVPEEKCVVALVPRWRMRSEERRKPMGDPEDRLTHFLIRNGECLFRTSVDFSAGERLIPGPEEFVQFFKRERWEGDEKIVEALKPNTRAYQEAMERSDNTSRHYLRIGLILQGLVDRTEIFAPLHPAGINMLSDPSGHSEKVRIVTDAEGGLESGELGFQDWQAATNEQLRVGMRVVIASNGEAFRHANSRNGEYRYQQRVHPNTADAPPEGVPLVIEDNSGSIEDGFVVRYPRGEVYDEKLWVESKDRPGWGHYGGRRPSKQRASCQLSRSDRFILAYDLIDAQLMERFLGNRRDRREYQELWPLMRSVWRAKREEEAAEAPFRQMLAGVLARDNGVSVGEAELAIPELVRWYKLSNRFHRPLAGSEFVKADEAKAVRLITAEHRRRVADATRTVRGDVVDQLAQANPAYLVIARPRRGGYIVLTAEEPDRDIYVRERVYSAKGELQSERENVLVGNRSDRWKIVRESERWAGWDRMARPQEHITVPEREQLVQALLARLDGRAAVLGVTQDGPDGDFTAWTIDNELEFDPEHPLTGGGTWRAPEADGTYWRWRRKGVSAAPEIAGTTGYGPGRVRRKGDVAPWRAEHTVLFRDDAMFERLTDEQAAHADAMRFKGGVEATRDMVLGSLGVERTRFSYHDHDEDQLVEALNLLIEAGELTHGMSMLDAWTKACELGLRGAWGEPRQMRGGGSTRSWVADAMPELEERLLDATIDLTWREEPEEPEEELDDEQRDGEVEDGEELLEAGEAQELRGKVRELVDSALAEPAEEVEPDAEFEDYDVLPAEG